MPQTQSFDMGGGQTIQGYSAGGLYDQALAETQARNPEFQKRYDELFFPTENT